VTGQQEWQGVTFWVDKAVLHSTSRQILPMHTQKCQIPLIKHDHKVLYYSKGA